MHVDLEDIEEFCNQLGLSFRRDYSGRGMYGRTCIGFITGSPLTHVAMLTEYLLDIGNTDVCDQLSNILWDTMADEYIVYFPSLQWSGIEDGSDDDSEIEEEYYD